MSPARRLIQNPESRIQIWGPLVILLLVLTGCTSEKTFNLEQREVYDAMQEWTAAVTRKDGEAMWDMLSPDAQDFYKRELTGSGGVRQQVALDKPVVAKDSMAAEEDKAKSRRRLATMPDNPKEMSPEEYYIWRVQSDFTPKSLENQVRLFDKPNIQEIHVDGGKASVKLLHGDPDRYSWVRHNGVWKFDLRPSILRQLEDVRKREHRK